MAPLRVLIAGGGVAGIEAALALRALARDRVAVELITPARARRAPMTAVGTDDGVPLRLALARLERRGVRVREGSVVAVDAAAHHVRTGDGATLGYDRLIVAVGASRRAAVPGALTLWDGDGDARFEEAVRALERRPDARLALVAPSTECWLLPLYELALQTARRVPNVAVVTPERTPLECFGEPASAAVARALADAGVTLATGAADAARAGAARAGAAGAARAGAAGAARAGAALGADVVAAAPALEAPGIDGLPPGFLAVDEHCAVLPDVYAAGDVTAAPVKHGGLAAQQADAAAAAIAAAAGAPVDPAPYRPALRALLLTEPGPLYLRRDEHGSVAAREALWWPPVKFAGRHLASFLLSGGASDEPLVDRHTN